jgi:DNA repair exonuclease SbcCD ATPase subunit
MKDLLKEALADAKTLKDTALLNAKEALEETFNSKIQSMLAAKLSEELEEDEEVVEEADEMEEEMEVETVEEEDKAEKVIDDAIEDAEAADAVVEEDELDIDAILASLEEMVDEEEEMEEAIEEAEETTDEEVEEEAIEEVETINLEALLAELTEEEGDETVEEEVVEEGLLDQLRSVFGSVLGTFERENADLVAKAKAKEIDAKDFMKEMNNWLRSNKIEAGFAQAARSLADEKYDLGLGLGGSKTGFGGTFESEMKEAQAKVEELTSQINEMNLLNAKLLYTNKLFKDNALTEEQKLKVVEALDEATNAKEAKLVYNTLKESLTPVFKKSLSEGVSFASKATGTKSQQMVTENTGNDLMRERFQKIAGIIK